MLDHHIHFKGHYGVVCGPMKTGKSGILIALFDRLQHTEKIQVTAYKPLRDTRDDPNKITSRGGDLWIPCTPFESSQDLYHLARTDDLVLVDEVQFCDKDISSVVSSLCKEKKHVILFGLDLDRNREPFGPMPNLMLHADYIEKLTAYCDDCGGFARYSKLFVPDTTDAQVLVGGDESYKAVCRNCY